jgi:hypothetical protein
MKVHGRDKSCPSDPVHEISLIQHHCSALQTVNQLVGIRVGRVDEEGLDVEDASSPLHAARKLARC